MQQANLSEEIPLSDRIISFVETLIVPSGFGVGQRFKLCEFQKRFIRDVYDPHEIYIDRNSGKVKKKRKVRRAILSIARKNGKTALIAALVLAHLCLKGLREKNGEIFSVANSKDQAGVVFKFVKQVIEASPTLSKGLKCFGKPEGGGAKMVKACEDWGGSVYYVVSADAGTLHGRSPSLWIYDELAQSKSEDLYDACNTSQGGRLQPLGIIISTQAADPAHILSRLIDDGITNNDETKVVHLYAVGEDCADVFDNEEIWVEANPALGDFNDVENMRMLAQEAKRIPSREASFRNLHLNQRISLDSVLIPAPLWRTLSAKSEDEKLQEGESIYLGLDLSTVADLSALVAVSADGNDRVKAWFWKPADKIKEHELTDRQHYGVWRDQGWITTTSGSIIDYSSIALKIMEIASKYKVVGLAYDSWNMDCLKREFNHLNYDYYVDNEEVLLNNGIRLVNFRQGYRTMSPAINALERSVISNQLRHDGNPVLTWNVSNGIVVTDPAGNRKIDKNKSRSRVDGLVAMVMAIGLKYSDLAQEQAPSIYESRGLF
jgi:phage terminase large subunit-like protein